jgi:hypothetical protein
MRKNIIGSPPWEGRGVGKKKGLRVDGFISLRVYKFKG